MQIDEKKKHTHTHRNVKKPERGQGTVPFFIRTRDSKALLFEPVQLQIDPSKRFFWRAARA